MRDAFVPAHLAEMPWPNLIRKPPTAEIVIDPPLGQGDLYFDDWTRVFDDSAVTTIDDVLYDFTSYGDNEFWGYNPSTYEIIRAKYANGIGLQIIATHTAFAYPSGYTSTLGGLASMRVRRISPSRILIFGPAQFSGLVYVAAFTAELSGVSFGTFAGTPAYQISSTGGTEAIQSVNVIRLKDDFAAMYFGGNSAHTPSTITLSIDVTSGSPVASSPLTLYAVSYDASQRARNSLQRVSNDKAHFFIASYSGSVSHYFGTVQYPGGSSIPVLSGGTLATGQSVANSQHNFEFVSLSEKFAVMFNNQTGKFCSYDLAASTPALLGESGVMVLGSTARFMFTMARLNERDFLFLEGNTASPYGSRIGIGRIITEDNSVSILKLYDAIFTLNPGTFSDTYAWSQIDVVAPLVGNAILLPWYNYALSKQQYIVARGPEI